MRIFSDMGVLGGKMVHMGVRHFTSKAMETQEKTLLSIMKKKQGLRTG